MVAATTNDHDDLVKEAHERVRIKTLSPNLMCQRPNQYSFHCVNGFFLSFQVINEGLNKTPATRKWTPESKLMEERNAAVSAAARAMLDNQAASDERDAHSRASAAFVRRYMRFYCCLLTFF